MDIQQKFPRKVDSIGCADPAVNVSVAAAVGSTEGAAQFRELEDSGLKEQLRWDEENVVDGAETDIKEAGEDGRDILDRAGSSVQIVDPFVNAILTTAEVLGTVDGPFTITVATDDDLKVAADGNPAETVTLAAGIGLTAAAVAADIASKATTFTAVAVGDKIKLVSLTSGTSSEIDIQAVANDCYTILGYSVGTTNGTAHYDASACAFWFNKPGTPSGIEYGSEVAVVPATLAADKVYCQYNDNSDVLLVGGPGALKVAVREPRDVSSIAGIDGSEDLDALIVDMTAINSSQYCTILVPHSNVAALVAVLEALDCVINYTVASVFSAGGAEVSYTFNTGILEPGKLELLGGDGAAGARRP